MNGEAFDSLTPREREVLAAFGRLARVGDVASALGRSSHTINNQLKSARLKLGVTDSLTAARMYLAASENLASQPLVIDPEPLPISFPPRDQADSPGPAAVMLQEERAVFDRMGDLEHGLPLNGGERSADDLKTPKAVLAPKAQFILTLAALVLAVIALAPYAARAIQDLANTVQPPD